MTIYFAKRANKVIKINEDAIDKYIAQGYNITDEQGNMVKKGTPHTAVQLTAEYKKQEAEIASLKAKNEALVAEVKALKEELSKAQAKAEETPAKEESVSAEPKQTRKRKQSTEAKE